MWISNIEIEFFRLMKRPEDPDNKQVFWPTPEEALFPGANTPVTALTKNGVLLWKHDGTVEHGDWNAELKIFTIRSGNELKLEDIRGWGPLPYPVAEG